jgi:flagellar hook-associated protein 2
MTTGPVSFGGLQSGLNTSQIISAEMSVFQQPLQVLQAQQSNINTKISDYQSLNSDMLALQQAGDAIANPLAFAQTFSVGSSNSFAASGAITSGSQTGSITFTVDQLAAGSTQMSAGSVSAVSNIVASGNFLIGSGGAALGIASFTAQSGLAVGAHTIAITQASGGATVSASTALTAHTSITATNNTIAFTLDGVASTLTIPAGTYTPTQLGQAITQASGGTLTSSIGSGGDLLIATTEQGSTASLQITGGSALATVGLAASSVISGTDGIITVDGTATTVTNIAAAGTTQLAVASGTGGSMTLNLSGKLNLGSMSAQNVSVGDGSLASVINAVNVANVGVSATALRTGTNQYTLELTSSKTGLAGAATVDIQAFAASSLGALQTSSTAQDSIVSVGGVGGPQISSSTNSVTGLLPGVTASLAQVSATPVTLSVSADGSKVASQVAALVDAANKVLTEISTDTAYNPVTGTTGPLNGQTSLTTLAQSVLSIVGHAIGTATVGSDGTPGESAGLAITATGTITFNQAAFVTAYNANPTGVQSMFIEGGTFSPASPTYLGQVSVAGAGDATKPGNYAVSISKSASQAVDAGSIAFTAPTSTLATAETYNFTSGTSTTAYAATAGESIANVVTGINAALAAAGIGASASLTTVSGSYHVQVSSADYGSTATFGVSTLGSDQLGLKTSGVTFTGTDVVGTINGQSATGAGQMLSLSLVGDSANGIVLQVNTPGIISATSLGTVNYVPGFAQALANAANAAISTPGGQIPATIAGLNSTLTNLTSEVALQKELVSTQQAMLTQEFAHMEMVLTQLSAESKFLTDSAASSSGSTSSSSSSSLFSSGSTMSTG